jgi:hypothetical protein
MKMPFIRAAAERQASGAGDNGSDGEADAVCRHLHAFVRRGVAVGLLFVRATDDVDGQRVVPQNNVLTQANPGYGRGTGKI